MSGHSWRPDRNLRSRRKTPRKCDWYGRKYHPVYRNANPTYCGVPCSAAAWRAGVSMRSAHREKPNDPQRAAEVLREKRGTLERLRKAAKG